MADNGTGRDSHASTFQWNGFAANRFKIVDITHPENHPSDSDGFDLDGLQVCGEPELAAVPTASLSADPELIHEGGSSILTWETANATTLAITPDVGTVTASGSAQVFPLETTTYTLSASGAGTATALAQVTVASSNPTAWWPMDGSVLDASGNGNHGTLFGTGGYTEGLFNQTLTLNGQADYVLVPDSVGLTLTDGFTLSTWVNPSAYGQFAKIISKRNDNQFWFLGLDDGVPYGGVGNGWYRVTPRPSGGDCDYVDTRVITPGEWHHLAFTFDHADKTMALWVDGQSRGRFGTRDDFTLPALEGINISIGADSQGTRHFFQGRIDDLRVYPRVLTNQEITNLYQAADLPRCQWAAAVVDFEQGLRKDGEGVISERSNPLTALDEMTGDTEEGSFVSLGFGGWLVLSFEEAVTNGSITVFETSWDIPTAPETAAVYGWNGTEWIYIGAVNNQEGTDSHPTTLEWSDQTFKQFKILDTTNPDDWSQGTRTDGFDVDAVKICGVLQQNTPPVAYAGEDQAVYTDVIVHLDGSLSADGDGDNITFFWSFTSFPEGSQVELDEPYAVYPEFVPDLPGEYVIQLTVNDGRDNSAPDTVIVTAETNPNHKPVFTSTPSTEATTNDLYQYKAVVTDQDEEVISFALEAAPDGMTIDAYGFITWVPAGEGTYQVVIIAQDTQGGEARQAYGITVAAGTTLPNDPGGQAPAPASGGVSTPEGQFAFLYSGDAPIQKEADSATFSKVRLSVIRGRVTNRDGLALPAVTIRIKNHPEYGYTLTRADGWFDMAVNGGETLVIQYAKSGYFPAQRTVELGWNDWGYAGDVALVTADSKVTTIDLSDTGRPFQVAQGNPVSDDAGDRRATILFPAGTSAVMTLPDGSTQALTTLNVRATEYSVGENGPKAMPAKLPPETGYTYCVELSADEAIAADAKRIDFSQTLYTYVDNFLEFPVGGVVPVGYYDYDLASWVASANGMIVKILSIADGKAVLSGSEDESEATADQLSALNVTDEEREQLAALFSAGQSFWRVPLTHFSTVDHNWPWGPPADAVPSPPIPPEPMIDDIPPDGAQCRGCLVDVQSMSLGEEIDLVGVPYHLTYQSNRVLGRKGGNIVDIPISSDVIPSSLREIQMTISVAGQVHRETFAPAANLSPTFIWDGLDVYGREVVGGTKFQVNVTYVYNANYYTPGSEANDIAWRQFTIRDSSGYQRVIGNRAGTYKYSRDWVVNISNPYKPLAKQLGGWSLNVHHGYDPMARVIYTGDGRRTAVSGGNFVITPIFEWGNEDKEGITVSPEGDVYYTDSGGVYKFSGGVSTRVVGTGVRGYAGDGGPAVNAQVDRPVGIDFGPDGCLYIADFNNHCIRKVDQDGIITTIAGTGTAGFSGDGGPGVNARMKGPYGLYVSPDGTIYVTEYGGYRVRRVSAAGTINTVVSLNHPTGIVGGIDGSLYVALYFNNEVVRVDPSGSVTKVAGALDNGGSDEDGIPAVNANVYYPTGLAIGPDNALYIVQFYGGIRRVGGDGIITRITGGGHDNYLTKGNGGPATRASIYANLTHLDFAPDGTIYVAASGTDGIGFKLHDSLPGFGIGEYAIPDESGGEYYVFDSEGRHLRTVDAFSNNNLLTFYYNDDNQLVGMEDLDGDVTTIERNASGDPQAIVGPDGQRTTLTQDENGYLKTVTDPAGQAWEFTYTHDGLLTRTQNPRKFSNQYTYDDVGRFLSDTDPAGGGWTLDRMETDDIYSVTMTSGENRISTYAVETLAEGGMKQTNTAPNGSVSLVEEDSAGDITRTEADGTVVSVINGPDPRFGMMAPVALETTITLPSGVQAQMSETREVVLGDENDPESLASVIETRTLNDKTSTTVYNADDHHWEITSPSGRRSIVVTDEKGRIVVIAIPGLEITFITYDTHGRVETISQGLGTDARTSTVTYHDSGDQAGWPATVTDSVNRVTQFQYDAAGRMTRQTLPGNLVVQVGYDANGNSTSITPPGKPIHAFIYNNVDLKAAYTPPVLAQIADPSTTYSYNRDQQFTNITLPGGRQGQALYNTAGQLIALSTPEGSHTFGYQAEGGRYLESITTPDNDTLSFTYDGAINTGATWTGTVNGQYNLYLNNDLKNSYDLVNDESSVQYRYDQDGLLVSAGQMDLFRDPSTGFLTGSTLYTSEQDIGADITTEITYNSFGEMETYTARYTNHGQIQPYGLPVEDDAGLLYAAEYTGDKAGRIETKTEITDTGAVTYTYVYDIAGRLHQVLEDDVLMEENTYAPNGNRTQIMRDSETITATYDDQDRMVTFGDNSYTYTDNGDLTTKTNGEGTTSYQYDLLGNLTQVTLPGGGTIEYTIDGLGRRIGKKVGGSLVQAFIYKDAVNPAAELDGNGQIVTRFIYGEKENVPSYLRKVDPDTGYETPYVIISDHLGSPRLVVNVMTGDIAQEIVYDAWGRVLLDTNPGFQPFGFAGGLYDRDTGLVRFGFRDYDPETGRWTAKDLVLFSSGDANIYLYCKNDPINYRDFFGLETEGRLDMIDSYDILYGRKYHPYYSSDQWQKDLGETELKTGRFLWKLIQRILKIIKYGTPIDMPIDKNLWEEFEKRRQPQMTQLQCN